MAVPSRFGSSIVSKLGLEGLLKVLTTAVVVGTPDIHLSFLVAAHIRVYLLLPAAWMTSIIAFGVNHYIECVVFGELLLVHDSVTVLGVSGRLGQLLGVLGSFLLKEGLAVDGEVPVVLMLLRHFINYFNYLAN